MVTRTTDEEHSIAIELLKQLVNALELMTVNEGHGEYRRRWALCVKTGDTLVHEATRFMQSLN